MAYPAINQARTRSSARAALWALTRAVVAVTVLMDPPSVQAAYEPVAKASAKARGRSAAWLEYTLSDGPGRD
ncbi:hypothetical protein GCM10009839_42840 [Catenulispora yoronensis]|uniref:Uncharacterized protein n=1 Tax=Catenulispora yoronensis TaxID=450799 RepID=A0ABP5FZ58_9ACTN